MHGVLLQEPQPLDKKKGVACRVHRKWCRPLRRHQSGTVWDLHRKCVGNALGTSSPVETVPSLSASAIRLSQAAENATTAATFALIAARLTRQAAPLCFYPAAVQEPLRPVLYVRTPPRAFKMCDAVDDKTCKHQCRKQSVRLVRFLCSLGSQPRDKPLLDLVVVRVAVGK